MRAVPQHPDLSGKIFLHEGMQTDILWDMFEKIDSRAGGCFAPLKSEPDSQEWAGKVSEKYSTTTRVYNST